MEKGYKKSMVPRGFCLSELLLWITLGIQKMKALSPEQSERRNKRRLKKKEKAKKTNESFHNLVLV